MENRWPGRQRRQRATPAAGLTGQPVAHFRIKTHYSNNNNNNNNNCISKNTKKKKKKTVRVCSEIRTRLAEETNNKRGPNNSLSNQRITTETRNHSRRRTPNALLSPYFTSTLREWVYLVITSIHFCGFGLPRQIDYELLNHFQETDETEVKKKWRHFYHFILTDPEEKENRFF